jgi:STE24 endopeptidase
MLPPVGALLSHVALAFVCGSAVRLVALSAGPDPRIAHRLRRSGPVLALALAAGWGVLVGTDAHVARAAGTFLPSVPIGSDLPPTLGTVALFCGPAPLAAYAAYHGADAAVRSAGHGDGASPPSAHRTGSPRGFLGGYAAVVGPALALTALAPAVPDGWWLVAGVAAVGFLLAAGAPLFVRRMVPTRPLTAAERVAVPSDVPVHVLLTGRGGPANALAAGVLPGLRCVYVTERLLESLPPHEAAAIVTHEVGHHRRRHVSLRLGAVAAYVLPWLGATALSVPGAFPVGLVLLVPATLLIFRLVRWTEYDADAYAARHASPEAMRDALSRLGGQGLLGDPASGGPLALHPSLDARVARLEDRRVRHDDHGHGGEHPTEERYPGD